MTCMVVTRFGVLASEVVLVRAIQDPYLLLELLLMRAGARWAPVTKLDDKALLL